MAFSITPLGTLETVASGNPVLTLTAVAPAGCSIIVTAGLGLGPTDYFTSHSVTDDAGNTYAEDDGPYVDIAFPGSVAALELRIFSAHNVDPLGIGDEITFNLSPDSDTGGGDFVQLLSAYALTDIEPIIQPPSDPADIPVSRDETLAPDREPAAAVTLGGGGGRDAFMLALVGWEQAANFDPDGEAFTVLDTLEAGSGITAYDAPKSLHLAYRRIRNVPLPNAGYELTGTLEDYPEEEARAWTSLAAAYDAEFPSGGPLSFDRGAIGLMNLAQVDGDGAVVLSRYSDAVPEVEETSVSVDATGGGQDVSLRVWRSGIWDAVYARSGNLYRRLSRDQGRTWGAETGIWNELIVEYTAVSHWIDPVGGFVVLAAFNETAGKWSVFVLPADAGTLFSFPTDIAFDARAAGDLKRQRDGRWSFAWIDTSDTVYLQFCKALKSDGTGDWTDPPIEVATGYQGVSHWWDAGLMVVALYDTAAETWKLTVGTLDADGTTWTWSTPADLVTGADSPGEIRLRGNGTWEFAYVNTDGDTVLLECRNLASDGTGAWS